jgi:hypothetical protein
MKTKLIEQLKPELKDKLEGLEELYPNSIREIFNELEEHYYYSVLSFNCVMDLVMYLELKNHEPLTIRDLFIKQD